ncbi:MAG: beta-lactamase family protein [Desulfobacterales bacterium]|nr:beta-lactamase family protein [Desulfobacterales bacterium]
MFPVVKNRADFLIADEKFQPGSYRHTHEIFPSRIIKKGTHVDMLSYAGNDLDIEYSHKGEKHHIDEFMALNKTTGFLVIKDGVIHYENYAFGATADSLFTSFSVGKSITGTLVGMAIGDGYIKSVNDLLVKFLPSYKGSGYDGVTVKQALQMSSGVRFVEEYAGGESEFSRFFDNCLINRTESFSQLMSSLQRKHEPGSVFNYSTGESTVLGDLVNKATGKTLSGYLSEKIWSKIGMEKDAYWVTDNEGDQGLELGGGSLSTTLRDYGRFGLLMLNDGKYKGKRILPEGWVAEATTPDAPQVQPGKLYEGYPLGYQYQWWTFPGDKNHPYVAIGVHGQFIYINPAEKLVIAKTSVWPMPEDDDKEMETYDLFAAIEEALH